VSTETVTGNTGPSEKEREPNEGVRFKHIPLKHTVDLLNGFPYDSNHFNEESGTPLIRIRDLTAGSTKTYVKGPTSPESCIIDGDLIIAMDGDFNSATWKGGDAVLNQRLCKLVAGPSLEARFLAYYIDIPLKAINRITHYTTVKHLSSLDLLNEVIPVPLMSLQVKIADFLDRETNRIDAIIDARLRMIELLVERRQAVITETVTGNIGPVKKVEVLSQRVRLDWVAAKVRETVNPKDFEGQVVDLFSIPDFDETGWAGLHQASTIESNKQRLRGGEVLISRLNPRKSRVLHVEYLSERPALCSSEFICLKPFKVDPKFLLHFLRSESTRQFLNGAVQSVTRSHQRIRPDTLTKMWIDLPSIPEQQQIADFLDRETNRIDVIIGKCRESVELLRERRQALITAAVTGELEVAA
jgi:type I restriction enzyme, S subunit